MQISSRPNIGWQSKPLKSTYVVSVTTKHAEIIPGSFMHHCMMVILTIVLYILVHKGVNMVGHTACIGATL